MYTHEHTCTHTCTPAYTRDLWTTAKLLPACVKLRSLCPSLSSFPYTSAVPLSLLCNFYSPLSPSLLLCFLLSAHCVLTPLKHFQVSLKYLFYFLGNCRKFLGNRSSHPLAPLAQSITNNKSIYLVYVAPCCPASSPPAHWQSHLSSPCCRFYSCQCGIALNLH